MLGILTTMFGVIATLMMAYMRKGFDELGTRIDALQQVTEVRFTAVDQRLDRVETRLDRVETRLDRVETRLDSIDRDVHVLSLRVAEMRDDSPPPPD